MTWPAIKRIWAEVLDLLFPPNCEVCGRDTREAFCAQCQEGIEYITAPYCRRCNVPFPPEQQDRLLCSECRQKASALLAVRSVGLHCGPLRQAVLNLKFQGALRLVEPLARMMYERVLREADEPGGMPVERVEAIVPAVLHPKRRRWRGFDQALLLARALSQLWEVPCLMALERIRPTRPQVELEHRQRERNVAGAFRVRRAAQVEGKTLLVVDDVWTTGATLEACATALRRAGARAVYGLTVTRTVPPWHAAATQARLWRGA